jgi:hypothetical protein
MERIKKAIASILLCAIIGVSHMQAAENLPVLMQTATDSRAGEILERAYRYIGSLESFSLRATLSNEDLYRGRMVVELTHRIDGKLKRPGKLRIDISGDSRNRSYFVDQGILSTYDRSRRLYAQVKVPQNIDGALDFAYENYDIKTPLANILYSDLADRLMPQVQGYYFGMVYVGDTLCDYIGFSNQKESFQVWVAKGDKPLIRKYVVIDKTSSMRLHSRVSIEWNNDVKIQEKNFTFIPGKEAKKIEMVLPEGEE